MKLKSLFSLLAMGLFAVLAGGSTNENGNISGWVWVVGLAIVAVIVLLVAQRKIAEKRRWEAEEERWQKERERQQAVKEACRAARAKFIREHGEPDKMLVIDDSELNSEIMVYDKQQKVFILGKEYAYSDVLGCTFSDSPHIIRGQVSSRTETDSSDVISRALIGDLLAGSKGAIIGGATAKTNTVYHHEPDITVHDYTVVINVNNISEPVIRINTGGNEQLTNEIVGVMNIIISRR